jgi:hypothetical protein
MKNRILFLFIVNLCEKTIMEGRAYICIRDLIYLDNYGDSKILKAGTLMTFKKEIEGTCILVWGNKYFLVKKEELEFR